MNLVWIQNIPTAPSCIYNTTYIAYELSKSIS